MAAASTKAMASTWSPSSGSKFVAKQKKPNALECYAQKLRSLNIEDFDRCDLPVGVRRTTRQRMRLDVETLNPVVLKLRMNNQNLKNEMNQHGGNLVSKQYARMLTAASLPELRTSPTQQSQGLVKRGMKMDEEADSEKEKEKKEKKKPPTRRTKKLTKDEEVSYLTAQSNEINVKAVDLLQDPDSNVEAVFNALATDTPLSKGLERDTLPHALTLLGLQDISKKDLENIVKLSDVRGLLFTIEEFARAVVLSNMLKNKRLEILFNKMDQNGNGTISEMELRTMFWDRGYSVSINVVEEVMHEAAGGRCVPFELDMSRFENAVALIDTRHGFSKREADELNNLFDRYDKDNSGELDEYELASTLGFFGTPTSIKHAAAIMQAFDLNGSGGLCRVEFLRVMRMRLEKEIADIRQLFAKFDVNLSGTMDISEFHNMAKAVGYSITLEDVSDLFDKKAFGMDELVFEDVFNVLYALRLNEGFGNAEVKELDEVFEKHALREGGELRDFELAFALTWLGYPLQASKRRKLWCKIDIDKSEGISRREFLKLIRLLREDEVAAAQSFLDNDDQVSKSPYLRESGLRHLLITLGYSPPQELFQAALELSVDSTGDGSKDVHGILQVFRFIREKQVTRLRQCAGLPDHMALKVRHRFGARASAGKTILAGEVSEFLFECLKVSPDLPHIAKRANTLIDKYIGYGVTQLNPIFWVLRHFCNAQLEDQWKREQDAADAAGFTTAEVAQYRQYFVDADLGGSGTLSMRELHEVLDEMSADCPEQMERASEAYAKLSPNQVLDFAEFLRVMRVVQPVLF